MSERRPVDDWASDFDHLSEEWAQKGPEILAELRDKCPVAHTDRFFGAYLVTRYDDIAEAAHNTEQFSSRITAVNENHPDRIKLQLPPITLDPPEHGPIRRALLPAFNPREVAALEPYVVEVCERLVDGLAGRDRVDGALDYAQMVPVEIMGHLFGVSPDMGPQFREWVNGLLKEGQIDLEIASRVSREVKAYFADQLNQRREEPRDDLVTMVLNAEAQLDDGTTRPFTEIERIGALFVLMLGGIDTTWSTLGSSLYHLGTHPDDLERLTAEPELLPTAIEEFLRFYSPVTIARYINEDSEVGGCPVKAGERMLLSYGSANRDPAHFERPDQVVLDREHNRHMSFGSGIHRCLGSNLARMELTVALRTWLDRFPRFELAIDPSEMRWSVGPIRGPREVPLRILAS
ncbi:MAG: cytochrome P450 [Acidimicrobiia bacterium]|nr:cytochrome P450 [Acidimicrobiia bacterium]